MGVLGVDVAVEQDRVGWTEGGFGAWWQVAGVKVFAHVVVVVFDAAGGVLSV